MDDVSPADLLDDINTDAMTPAWVCFDHDPKAIATTRTPGSSSPVSAWSRPARLSPAASRSSSRVRK